ncbi:DUF6754 domain-containing protein [Planctomicrobium sp. SH527]|uniref:DUF6754 domain-containing protein n=1 Tax=Planctomicrobium sp. SH527 TaxID=3448123 RepID=UPI003F5AE9F0
MNTHRHHRRIIKRTPLLLIAFVFCCSSRILVAAPPAPPRSLTAADVPHDNGTRIQLTIGLPVSATSPANPPGGEQETEYVIEQSGEYRGLYHEVDRVVPSPQDIAAGKLQVTVSDLHRNVPYWFRVKAMNADGESSTSLRTAEADPTVPTRQLFDGSRYWLLIMTLVICGGIMLFIALAKSGMKLKIRKIAGLDAIEEAVGRATEMGRACLFVPGVQDMNEMQTIAGLTLLGRVAERAAEFDCHLDTPTSKALVMTAARETVSNAFLAAGRPEAYQEDTIYYVTDDQFAYVSHITGKMVREKPAACFYLGSFYAESLILAETGNSIGAIQIAGTAQPAQLPFFVAACDYTLIGEEFFAASAYLSNDPNQLGSLKGQDFAKIIVVAIIVVGVGLATAAHLTGNPMLTSMSDYLRNQILSGT